MARVAEGGEGCGLCSRGSRLGGLGVRRSSRLEDLLAGLPMRCVRKCGEIESVSKGCSADFYYPAGL